MKHLGIFWSSLLMTRSPTEDYVLNAALFSVLGVVPLYNTNQEERWLFNLSWPSWLQVLQLLLQDPHREVPPLPLPIAIPLPYPPEGHLPPGLPPTLSQSLV